jgi:energy-coupling factor transport system ATP-binding protein
MIEVSHLSYTYRADHTHKKVLDDVSLNIMAGQCVAIIGFNGSGKTTLIQHFNGLLRPTDGSVLIDGIDVGASGTDLRSLRQRVGMLFQFPESQLFARSIYQDVAFGPRRMKLGRHEVRARVLAALDMVGLPQREYGWRSPFDLSGGQRRRVALAGVIAMTPKVLVLDEPSIGLDGEGRAEFYRYVRRVQQEQGVTIVLVSHDMSEVAALAEWLFVLYDGRLVMQGTPRDVFTAGEQLRAWHLAPPPLEELLVLLRKQGLPVPTDLYTLEDVCAYLMTRATSVKYAE